MVLIEASELERRIEAAVERVLERRTALEQPSEWVDVQGAAELLGVCTRTVTKLVRRSGLPAHRVGPKLLRFRRSELIAWLSRDTAPAGAEGDP